MWFPPFFGQNLFLCGDYWISAVSVQGPETEEESGTILGSLLSSMEKRLEQILRVLFSQVAS